MPRKVVEEQIGPHKFRIRQLGSDTQFEIISRMVLGASTGTLQVTDITGVRQAFMANTDVEITDTQSPQEVKPRTWVPLANVASDLFADDVMTHVLWLKRAAEVSFANFSDALAVLQKLRADLSNSSSDPSTVGSSTAS